MKHQTHAGKPLLSWVAPMRHPPLTVLLTVLVGEVNCLILSPLDFQNFDHLLLCYISYSGP